MWMEFTPKDWLMMRVGLIFCEGDPDPEDPWVRSYLDEQQLVPRHQGTEERNGIACDVLYFGQCYLGQHLHALQKLNQKGLERSLILEKLRELRHSPSAHTLNCLVSLDERSFGSCLPALAEALHPEVNFGTNSEGYLSVALDPTMIAGELTRLRTASPQMISTLSPEANTSPIAT